MGLEGIIMELYTKVVQDNQNMKWVILFEHGKLKKPLYVIDKWSFEKMMEDYKNQNSLEKYS